MRKDYAEMLLDITKTATDDYPMHKTVAALDCCVMATDAKRALRITAETPFAPDGLYQIAKVGKDYQMIASSESGRYPDIDGIMRFAPKTVVDIPCMVIDAKNKLARISPDYFPARLLTVFGSLQADTASAELTSLNYVFLSVVTKKMAALANSTIQVGYYGPTYPLKLSCNCGVDKIDYVIMPISF